MRSRAQGRVGSLLPILGTKPSKPQGNPEGQYLTPPSFAFPVDVNSALRRSLCGPSEGSSTGMTKVPLEQVRVPTLAPDPLFCS